LKILRTVATQIGEGVLPRAALRIWIAACVEDPQTVAQFLSSDEIVNTELILAIAEQTYPDFVPNEYGQDPWWTVVERIGINLPENDRQYLSAYLLARALGHRSRNQAELIQASFDNIYFPLAHDRLSQQAWRIIDPRLPRSWPWLFDWDSCRRLLDSMADAFVHRELSPIRFAQITKDNYVFKQLASTAAATYGGRTFLQNVIQVLNDQDPLERQKILKKLAGSF
jgi:hypothetical protein